MIGLKTIEKSFTCEKCGMVVYEKDYPNRVNKKTYAILNFNMLCGKHHQQLLKNW